MVDDGEERGDRDRSRFARLLWVDVPVGLARLVPRSAGALTDGQYLLRWPLVAALAPFAAGLTGVGLEIGQQREVFTTSWMVVSVLVVVGSWSVQLGVWAFVGYVAADWVTGRSIGLGTILGGNDQVPDGLEASLSAAIESGLLAVGVVGLPVVVARIRRRLLVSGWTGVAGRTGERVAALAVTVLGLWAWLTIAPGAARATFVVEGLDPAIVTIDGLAGRTIVVLGVAAAAVAIRFVVEARATGPAAIAALVDTNRGFQAAHRHDVEVRIIGRVVGFAAGVVLLAGSAGRPWHLFVTAVAVAVAVGARDWVEWSRCSGALDVISPFTRLAIVAGSGAIVADRVGEVSGERRLVPDGSVGSMVVIWVGVAVIGVMLSRPMLPLEERGMP